MRLLIVDDQQSVHLYLEKVLSLSGLGIREILHAYDGQEAMDLLRTHPVELMLLDIEMPRMDGIALLRNLPTLPAPRPWVVILTAYDEFEYARAALQSGAKDYLLKPIDQAELVGKLKTLTELLREEQKERLRHLFAQQCARLAQHPDLPEGPPPESACPTYAICCLPASSARLLDRLPVEERLHKPQNGNLFALLIPAENELPNMVQILHAAHEPFGISQPYATPSRLPHALREALAAAMSLHDGTHIVARIRQYIDEHYGEELSLEEISSRFFISKFQLSRLFKKQYQVNYHDYVTQVRMKAAADLLRHSSLRLYEVSERVGYEQASHFSSVFKRYYAQSPRDYRQAHQSK